MKHLLIILFLLVQHTTLQANTERVLAKKGLLDLRADDFSKKVRLDGEWEFYWQQLQPPLDTSDRIFVPFPSLWNELEIDGERVGGIGYGAYRLTVLLPSRTEPLRIRVPETYCAYRLYLNGEVILENGVVADNPEDFVPQWLNLACDIPLDIDTAELVLVIANFVHSKGGIREGLIIGDSTQMTLDRRRIEAVDLFLTGCLFMGGLFFLGLYLLGNRDKAILLFSLFSIIYCYRIMGIENYALHTLIPTISWHWLVHFEYLTLFIAVGLFTLYTKYLYPHDANHWVVRLIYGICTLFVGVTVFAPPFYFSQLINPFLLVTIVCIFYALYVYFLAYRSNRMGSAYALLSTLALMMLFVLSMVLCCSYRVLLV